GIPHPGKPAGFFESSVEPATADPDIRSSRSVMTVDQIADQFFLGSRILTRNAMNRLNAPTPITPTLYDAEDVELWAVDNIRFSKELLGHARDAMLVEAAPRNFSLLVESSADGTRMSLQQVADRWFDSSVIRAKGHLTRSGILNKVDMNGQYLMQHVNQSFHPANIGSEIAL
ncbi:MAG: hypothetical protein ACDS79_07970, partial [Enterobacteriaceae bacterium]